MQTNALAGVDTGRHADRPDSGEIPAQGYTPRPYRLRDGMVREPAR
jgi:hypothetical protein